MKDETIRKKISRLLAAKPLTVGQIYENLGPSFTKKLKSHEELKKFIESHHCFKSKSGNIFFDETVKIELSENDKKKKQKKKEKKEKKKQTTEKLDTQVKQVFEIKEETFEPRNLQIEKIEIDEKEVLELLKILPEKYFDFFADQNLMELIDIEMDFNRIPKAHFFQSAPKTISEKVVSMEDIENVTNSLEILGNNRSGIDRYLHRISVIRSQSNDIIGITLRVGKPIIGISNIIADILDQKKSILFLGPPGTGKTSIIRDIARYISDKTRTIIVDSSSEISGFGSTPHHSIGEARVMKIPESKNQEKIMIEAIQNHTPEALIIDEIGTQFEVFATKECSQRGIILYASAHGTVQNLEKNQTIMGLVGGIESVIMGEKSMQLSGSKEKIQRRLKYKPLFDVIVEFQKENRDEWTIYHNIEELMNNILSGKQYMKEVRVYDPKTGTVKCRKEMEDNLM